MKSKELKELNYYAEVTQWNEDVKHTGAFMLEKKAEIFLRFN